MDDTIGLEWDVGSIRCWGLVGVVAASWVGGCKRVTREDRLHPCQGVFGQTMVAKDKKVT